MRHYKRQSKQLVFDDTFSSLFNLKGFVSLVMENSRKRSINWDEAERTLLREVITPRIGVIHDKNTDSKTNKAKKHAWEEIAKCFNTINTRPRSVLEIKAQWKCMKMKAKASESAFSRRSRQTGGGPRPTSPSQEDQKMISLIPSEFERDHNEFDCDGLPDSDEFTIVEIKYNTQNLSSADYLASGFGFIGEDSIADNSFKGNKTPKLKRRNSGESSTDCKKQTADPIRGEIGSLTVEAIRQKMAHRQLEHNQLMKEKEELLEMKRAEHAQLLRHREELHKLEIEALKKKHC